MSQLAKATNVCLSWIVVRRRCCRITAPQRQPERSVPYLFACPRPCGWSEFTVHKHTRPVKKMRLHFFIAIPQGRPSLCARCLFAFIVASAPKPFFFHSSRIGSLRLVFPCVYNVPASDEWVLGFKSLLQFQLLLFLYTFAQTPVLFFLRNSCVCPSSLSNMCSIYLTKALIRATLHLDKAASRWQMKAVVRLCVGAVPSAGYVPHFRT